MPKSNHKSNSIFIEKLRVASSFLKKEKRQQLNTLSSLCQSNALDPIVFVCTHNSRRSQAAELILFILAEHFKLNRSTASCGTERTAFHPNMVKAFNSFGIELIQYGTDNPLFVYHPTGKSKYLYSKSIADLSFPAFIVITVCSDAEDKCPYLPEATARYHLGFEDPKKYDGTEEELRGYQDKIIEIGSQLFYLAKKMQA